MTNQPSLIDLYLDGDASAQQVAQLEQWINDSDENAAEFLRRSFDHHQLHSLLVAQENVSLIEFGEERVADVDWDALMQLEADADTGGPIDITQRLEQEKRNAERARLEAKRRQLAKPEPHRTRVIVIPKWSVVIGIAALVALVVTPLYMMFSNSSAPTPQHAGSDTPREIVPDEVVLAKLESAIQAQWEGSLRPDSGSGEMTPGTYHLSEGTARLRYDQGVEVIVQAPAIFELVDATKIDLASGQLSVLVSTMEGRGFVVNTDAMRIVDLGTEFGVVAEASGQVSAHVYQGLVEVYDANAIAIGDPPAAQLQVGEAVTTEHHDAPLLMEVANALAVVRSFEYEARQRVEQGTATGYERWLAWSMQVRRDPTVFAYYAFDNREEDANSLTNRAAATQGSLDGQFTNLQGARFSEPQWAEGRWPGKDALRFRSVERDHVLIPRDEAAAFDDLGQVTIACWVRVEDPTQVHHLITKRSIDRDSLNFAWVGELTVQAVGDPSMHREYSLLGALHPPSQGNTWRDYESQSVLRDQAGWALVAMVYDGQVVRFYLNDQLVGSYRDATGIQSSDADILIGGVTRHSVEPWLYLDGHMDELVIWGRALDANEIRAMCVAGEPGAGDLPNQ